MTFELNKTLEADSKFITELELCQLRLMNNANFPWAILVPKLNNIVEITDLSDTEYLRLNEEVRLIARALQKEFTPDKLNIAAIGNVVSQLHVHVIARFRDDILFPKPVWGHEAILYTVEQLENRINKIKAAIKFQFSL